ncbi:hypothetical protein IJ556_03820 [bacterium]|nr:hypothetical protein [bacterium]
MMVDVSGLDMFKDLQKALKPLDLTPKNSLQYAANDKTNVASDVLYLKNMLSDEECLLIWRNSY